MNLLQMTKSKIINLLGWLPIIAYPLWLVKLILLGGTYFDVFGLMGLMIVIVSMPPADIRK